MSQAGQGGGAGQRRLAAHGQGPHGHPVTCDTHTSRRSREVQYGPTGGQAGKVARDAHRAPAGTSSLGSHSLKLSVHVGLPRATWPFCSWGWPSPAANPVQSHPRIEAGSKALWVAARGPGERLIPLERTLRNKTPLRTALHLKNTLPRLP